MPASAVRGGAVWALGIMFWRHDISTASRGAISRARNRDPDATFSAARNGTGVGAATYNRGWEGGARWEGCKKKKKVIETRTERRPNTLTRTLFALFASASLGSRSHNGKGRLIEIARQRGGVKNRGGKYVIRDSLPPRRTVCPTPPVAKRKQCAK